MKTKLIAYGAALAVLLTGCAAAGTAGQTGQTQDQTQTQDQAQTETAIQLSDDGILVDGSAVSQDPAAAVYTGAELIYYHDGTDESYGEGTQEEMHSQQEAEAHTVLTITKAGTYRLSGTLSKGQIAVDLGEDAETDPEAKVTLILDGADITCTVAPAILFYRVYECGPTDEDTASAYVDTSAAGANIHIAAGTENWVNGSHVARIYKEGTTDKLYQYDGALYSCMSLNVSGDDDETSVLNITGDNEGLNSEMHLSILSGVITINSQDDGINTNEDGVSVTTIAGGNLTINAGQGAEGDGIDSNGYLTILGGTVWTMANETSPDGGLDADCGVILDGGTVYAFGVRNDQVDESSKQAYLELNFASAVEAGSEIAIVDSQGQTVLTFSPEKRYQSVIVASDKLSRDETYTVLVNGVETGTNSAMGPGGPQNGQQPPELPADGAGRPEGGQEPPEKPQGAPEDAEPAAKPDGQ